MSKNFLDAAYRKDAYELLLEAKVEKKEAQNLIAVKYQNALCEYAVSVLSQATDGVRKRDFDGAMSALKTVDAIGFKTLEELLTKAGSLTKNEE